MSAELDHAIVAAREVRRNLVRRFDTDLGGFCALASVQLAIALRSSSSLRYARDDVRGVWHVWNVVNGVAIDITATQFNSEPETRTGELVYGVLVTNRRHWFHRPLVCRGRAALARILCDHWYDRTDHYRIEAIFRKAATL